MLETIVRLRHRGGISICVCGEGMVEIRDAGAALQSGFGGDTLNTAIHLARFGFRVRFATALGDDPFSADMLRAWQGEGIDTSLIRVIPGRMPGLYAIRLDKAGERDFYYWRGESAARAMLDGPDAEAIMPDSSGINLFYFSLITLAILPTTARERLLAWGKQVRAAGGIVAFDGNYRSRLWADPREAAEARDRAIAITDIGLPTLADEIAIGEDPDPAAVAARWIRGGARDVVVKLGAEGCFADGRVIAPPNVIDPVDTSGAGDAFNAGYLAARIDGWSMQDAALHAHQLAAWTIAQPGAIPAMTVDAPYGSRAA